MMVMEERVELSIFFYLVLNDLLDTPILYLSKYIMEHRQDYYRHLQNVGTKGTWTDWILYILEGVF